MNLRTDDIFLMRYLTCCDWNATDAFIRMKKLFKLKVNVINSFAIDFALFTKLDMFAV